MDTIKDQNLKKGDAKMREKDKKGSINIVDFIKDIFLRRKRVVHGSYLHVYLPKNREPGRLFGSARQRPGEKVLRSTRWREKVWLGGGWKVQQEEEGDCCF